MDERESTRDGTVSKVRKKREKGRRRYECKFNFSFRAKEVDENREEERDRWIVVNR